MSKFHNKLALEASAGSGKTFALVVRYITLLFLDANPRNILALTFTNKAANEMRVRIFSTLKELHLAKRENELNEICSVLEISKEVILEKRESVIDRFIKSEIKISTIDSFLTSILRQFAFEASLMPDFDIQEFSYEKIFIDFLQNTFKNKKYKELINLSIYENRKLELIFEMFDKLYEKDSEISTLKVEDSSLESDVMKIFEELKELFLNCTNLSKSAKGLFEKVSNIYELQKSSWICKESLFSHNWLKKCSDEQKENLFISLKRELNHYIKQYEKHFFYNLFTLYLLYKNSNLYFKRKLNRVQFNDITNLVYKILNSIERDFLYFRLDSKIDHILLDEFQDTSIVQYKILEPIFEEISSGIGVKEFRSLFFVGDKKQSIYRFRGGTRELFDYFQQKYDIKRELLNHNYRSYAHLVEFVNKTFENKIKDYQKQITIDKKNRGYIFVKESEDILQEMINRVEELIKFGVEIEDIAILTHTNSDSLKIEERLIKELKIKVTTETSAKLINHKVIKALIELLKYLYFDEAILKANFLTLIGKSWDKEIEFNKIFSKNSALPKLINRALKLFSLPVDKSVLKFIEISYKYKDIEEFLFEYEQISESMDKKESEGVKILTIHKSKGLEFDFVIVMDRLGKKQPNTSSIIYEYNNIDLEAIYKREVNRSCFDNEYQKAIEKEKKLSFQDELNAQYVAFTRAKKAMMILKKEDSAFKNLEIDECEIGEIEITKKEIKISNIKEFDYTPLKLGKQEDKLSVTKSLTTDQKAIDFGLALHYLLEIIYDFKEIYLKSAFKSTKSRYLIYLNEEDLIDIKTRVKNLLRDSTFLSLLKNAKNIYKEQPLFFENELKQIDLLIEKENLCVIIDYKSSFSIKREHISQVIKYKKAIESIFKKKTVAYLCYINKTDIKFVEV